MRSNGSLTYASTTNYVNQRAASLHLCSLFDSTICSYARAEKRRGSESISTWQLPPLFERLTARLRDLLVSSPWTTGRQYSILKIPHKVR